MMTFGFCTQIWVPLFTFPTVQAPRFPNGYPAASVFEFSMWATLMTGVWYMKRWKAKHPDLEPIVGTVEVDASSNTELESQTVRVGDEKSSGKVGATGLV
jgi:ACS family pantothenate transporter-like MFS transporter